MRSPRLASLMAALGLGSLPTLAAAAPASGAWCSLSRSPCVSYHGLPTDQWAFAHTSLCGRPLQATGLGEGQWLVATTLGHAVVSTREGGAPQVVSGLVLLANQPAQGKGTAVVSPLTPPVLAVCKTLDALLPKGVVEGLQRTSALDASDAGHVVASWGSFAFWLNVSKPKEPQVNGVTLVPGWVHSFRVDDRGERVYGLRKLPNGSSEPLLLDARGGWRSVGTHEVAAWVERKEEGKLMARKRVGGQVDVAWRVQ